MFQAWANARGLRIVPGTLNLCADRDLVVPIEHAPLRPWDYALELTQRKTTPGYDPRLYFVVLNLKEPAWLFRWSAPEHLPNFVGDSPGCRALRRCEVIAEADLSYLWQSDKEAEVLLRFVAPTT